MRLAEANADDGFEYCSGVMGVPITFLDRYCPEQFSLIWTTDRGGDGMLNDVKISGAVRYDAPVVCGKGVYKRIMIRRFVCFDVGGAV